MRSVFVVLLSLLLAACAGTPETVSAPPVPVAAVSSGKLSYSVIDRVGLTPDELAVLTGRLDAGLAAVLVPAGTEGANQLRITLTGYRMIDEASRQVEGMVAGGDHVASVVRLTDPAGAVLIDDRRVLTQANRAAHSAESMLRQHGDDIGRVVAGD